MKEFKSKRDAKKLAYSVKKGDVLWVTAKVSKRHAPYEDSELLERHVVTHMHPLLGGGMCGGAMSVEALVLNRGPVYTERPKGYRAVHEPAKQVAPPLAYSSAKRPLNAREIREMEEEVANNLADRQGMARPKAKREAKKIVAKQLAGAR